MKNDKVNSKRILFFGRTKCNLSKSIFNQLKNFGFDVTFVQSSKRGQKLPKDIHKWEGDIMLCFRSLMILPKTLIEKAKVAAVKRSQTTHVPLSRLGLITF